MLGDETNQSTYQSMIYRLVAVMTFVVAMLAVIGHVGLANHEVATHAKNNTLITLHTQLRSPTQADSAFDLIQGGIAILGVLLYLIFALCIAVIFLLVQILFLTPTILVPILMFLVGGMVASIVPFSSSSAASAAPVELRYRLFDFIVILLVLVANFVFGVLFLYSKVSYWSIWIASPIVGLEFGWYILIVVCWMSSEFHELHEWCLPVSLTAGCREITDKIKAYRMSIYTTIQEQQSLVVHNE